MSNLVSHFVAYVLRADDVVAYVCEEMKYVCLMSNLVSPTYAQCLTWFHIFMFNMVSHFRVYGSRADEVVAYVCVT